MLIVKMNILVILIQEVNKNIKKRRLNLIDFFNFKIFHKLKILEGYI